MTAGYKKDKSQMNGGDCGEAARTLEVVNPAFKAYALMTDVPAAYGGGRQIEHLMVSDDGGKTFVDGQGVRTAKAVVSKSKDNPELVPATYVKDPKSRFGGYYKTADSPEEFDAGGNHAGVLRRLGLTKDDLTVSNAEAPTTENEAGSGKYKTDNANPKGCNQFTGPGCGVGSSHSLTRSDISDDEHVEMYSHHAGRFGEVVWTGTHAEAKQLIKEALEQDGPAGVEGLAIRRPSEATQAETPSVVTKKDAPTRTLPPPSDYKSFRTGEPMEAVVYRGETSGGAGTGMAALGHGRYYGLEPVVAERFSKAGTVTSSTVSLKKPAVVHSDDDMETLKKKAEQLTGEDFGKSGNMYAGFLYGDQPAKFTNALKAMGFDGIVTTYKEAPGGEQVVVFNYSLTTNRGGRQ
jgi:hypothetical protein